MRASLHGAFLAGALALSLAAWPQAKAAPEPAVLANKAMRQAMLAEQVARLYVQVGQGVLATRSKRTLPGAVREFSGGLAELSGAAPNAEVRENYILLKKLWDGFAPLAAQAPSLDGAKKIAERTEEIAWIAYKGARLYQSQLGLARTEHAMAAGVMRWRSQQVAKLHLLRHWGVRTEGIAAELAAAEAAYKGAVERLKDAERIVPEIADELRLAEVQYAFLGQAAERLAKRANVPRELEHIAKTGDNLLEITDRLGKLCETIRK